MGDDDLSVLIRPDDCCLIFVSSGTASFVDRDGFDLTQLGPRDRVLLSAFVSLVAAKLRQIDGEA